MKNLTKKLLVFTLILSMLVLAGCGGGGTTSGGASGSANAVDTIKAAGVLKVGVKSDVPKFGLVDTATNEYEGFEIDLAYQIAAEIFECSFDDAKANGLVEFEAVTAKTRGPLLENGQIDLVIATFTITEERKESYNFSNPYFTDAVRLLVKTSNGYNDLSDMDGAAIGVAQSSTTKESINAYIEENGLDVSLTYSEFSSYPEIKAALDSGRVQAFSVDGAILAGYNDDTTELLPDRFAPQDYGVASAIEKTDLAELVNTVVDGLKDSGELDTMLSGWGIE